MIAQLPDTGSIPTPHSRDPDGLDPLFLFRGFSHHQGNPHSPDPEATSWQTPGYGLIGKYIK